VFARRKLASSDEAAELSEPRTIESLLPLPTMIVEAALAASVWSPGWVESKSKGLLKPGSPAAKRLFMSKPLAGSSVICKVWSVSWAAVKIAVWPVRLAV
jgi:hypothetical protein